MQKNNSIIFFLTFWSENKKLVFMSFFSFVSRFSPYSSLHYIPRFTDTFTGSFSENSWEDAFNISKSGQNYFCFVKNYEEPKVAWFDYDYDDPKKVDLLMEKLKKHVDIFNTSKNTYTLNHFKSIYQSPRETSGLVTNLIGKYEKSQTRNYTIANYTNFGLCTEKQGKHKMASSVYYLCDPNIPDYGQIASITEEPCERTIYYFTRFACVDKINQFQSPDPTKMRDVLCIPDHKNIENHAKIQDLYRKIVKRKGLKQLQQKFEEAKKKREEESKQKLMEEKQKQEINQNQQNETLLNQNNQTQQEENVTNQSEQTQNEIINETNEINFSKSDNNSDTSSNPKRKPKINEKVISVDSLPKDEERVIEEESPTTDTKTDSKIPNDSKSTEMKNTKPTEKNDQRFSRQWMETKHAKPAPENQKPKPTPKP